MLGIPLTGGFVEDSSFENRGSNQVFFALTNRRFSMVIIRDGSVAISFPSQTNCRRFLIETKKSTDHPSNSNSIYILEICDFTWNGC